MKWKRFVAAGSATVVGFLGLVQSPASASSHREAPLISQDSSADNTDLYLFKDPKDATKVDVVANFIGLELPAGGPNFQKFSDDVLYEIHVNNDPNSVSDDITYSFRFRTVVADSDTFLYNTNQITAPNSSGQNVRQYYTVTRRDRWGTKTLVQDAPTPPVNVGPRSTPDYENKLALPTIASLSNGGKVFAGQRDDPFFADLGSVFDLLGLRPLNNAHVLPKAASNGVDGLAGTNVHSIVMQLPITDVSRNGNVPTTVDSKDSVIGVWASASRRNAKVIGDIPGKPYQVGRWVQVSRLGIPLVNEVLIPLGEKDKWNELSPKDDQQFFKYILDPEPARAANALYPALQDPPPGGFDASNNPKRSDIVAVLRGAALGLSTNNLLPPADVLRINLATPVSPANKFTRFGFLGASGNGSDGNADGFPNGRRLGDDIVDTELRLLVGGTALSPTPSSDQAPNTLLTDGVDANDVPLKTSFPYLATPFSGYTQTPPGHNAR